MTRAQVREELIAFLDTIRRPNYPMGAIGDCDSLVESGLIDSLAVLQIVLHLEMIYGIDFAEGGFDPDELGSISKILDLIERRSR
jgi:acyl carrier protein